MAGTTTGGGRNVLNVFNADADKGGLVGDLGDTKEVAVALVVGPADIAAAAPMGVGRPPRPDKAGARKRALPSGSKGKVDAVTVGNRA